ncbi:MAG: hypothetical protein HKP62_07150 [Sulfurovum sp.]|nr:hypothetical protein [Sulfurovum sp.]NNJ45776.1 hypothetical protein [Sulfurovum sp.]
MAHLNLYSKIFTTLAIAAGFGLLTVPATAGTLSLFNPSDIIKENQTVEINAQILMTNDAFSLEVLFNDLEGSLNEQDDNYDAIGDARFDIGSYIDFLGYVGYTHRKEVVMPTSSDTVRLLYQASNDLDLDIGESYDLDLKMEGFAAHGIMFANNFSVYQENGWDVNIGIGLELLYGVEMQDGYVRGNAITTAVNDYDFNMQSNYLYTENYLYDLDVESSHAYGYSTHLSIQAAYENISFSYVMNDLLGKLYWKDLPYSDVFLTSGTKSYDENGYVKYTPVISGVERTKDYTQTLMQKWRLEAKYTFENATLQLGNDRIYGINMPYVRYQYTHENDLTVGYNYETKFGMFGVDMRFQNYHFSIHADDLIDPSGMRASLGMHYTF